MDAQELMRAATLLSHELRRNSDISLLSPSDIWIELVRCLLSSQVRYDQVEIFLEAAVTQKCIAPLSVGEFQKWRLDFLGVLKGNNPPQLRHRFWRKRIEQIEICWHLHVSGKIQAVIDKPIPSREKRLLLAELMPGFGPKQTSMFMRNAYLVDDLAIIDVHTRRFAETTNSALSKNKALSWATYLIYEDWIRDLSSSIDCSVAIVDQAIWAIMRTLSEAQTWGPSYFHREDLTQQSAPYC